jgi:hypothetical protein
MDRIHLKKEKLTDSMTTIIWMITLSHKVSYVGMDEMNFYSLLDRNICVCTKRDHKSKMYTYFSWVVRVCHASYDQITIFIQNIMKHNTISRFKR